MRRERGKRERRREKERERGEKTPQLTLSSAKSRLIRLGSLVQGLLVHNIESLSGQLLLVLVEVVLADEVRHPRGRTRVVEGLEKNQIQIMTTSRT